jgi:DNA modification methylase
MVRHVSRFSIIHGGAEVTAAMYLKTNSFDACLCDPPYGFSAFTSRPTQAWEKEAPPSTQLWHQVYRVLRPGSMLMAASGARTYDLIAGAIRGAGFEILDQYNWIYNGANAAGVTEGYRLRPAVEPYIVARKPGKSVLLGRLNTGARVEGHLPTDVAMSNVYLDPLDGKNTFGFFFCSKATKDERNRVPTDHPTLKPLALTEHLARLIHQPKARRVLVPFSGVGSEMIGCLRAGWEEVVGLEREKKYVDVAFRRVPAFCPGAEAA